MARWTRNHTLEIGLVVGLIGLVGTAISFSYRWWTPTPNWLGWYSDLVQKGLTGDQTWNTFVFIAAPIMLIIGGFYVGEQLTLRRRFDKMLDTPKKSEFTSRRKDLEDLAKRLPDGYRKRISEKESEFVSKRA